MRRVMTARVVQWMRRNNGLVADGASEAAGAGRVAVAGARAVLSSSSSRS